MNSETRNCQNCKQSFVIDDEDFGFYEKMQVPPPTWCPECRMMRRMLFWNEHSFFKKLEKRTGKEIFSMYPPEAPEEIYDRDYWWTDAWDPLSYGREIDWSKPFLKQMYELKLKVPLPARSIIRSVKSDFSNNAADMKNCYLCFNADQCEDCTYGVGMLKMKSSLDMYRVASSELCYELFGGINNYQCFFTSISNDCRNLWLSYNCEDCRDCFGCVNLRHKQYHIFNMPYSKEEYFEKLKEMNTGSFKALSELQERFDQFELSQPRRFMTGYQNQSVSGDFIRYSKNTKYSFSVADCENVKYGQSILMGAKETYDYTNWGNNVELTYETQSVGEDAQRIKFSYECFSGVNDIEYSMFSPASSNLFGCVGLHKKQYCILNKQYGKAEYEALVPKIKKHMMDMPYVDKQGRVYKYGEFFPLEFSPYAVNETAVMDFMEMDKEKAQRYGLVWRESNPKEYQVTTKAAELPDHISEVKDDVTKQIVGCSSCGKGYRILADELVFLRRFGIPLPRMCFACRHSARVNLRNKPKFYEGQCQCAGEVSANGVYKNISKHASHEGARCPNTFKTSYAPNRPEIVYCETCYQAELV